MVEDLEEIPVPELDEPIDSEADEPGHDDEQIVDEEEAGGSIAS